MTLVRWTPAARYLWPELCGSHCDSERTNQIEYPIGFNLDLVEEQDHYTVKADLPGVKPDDLNVSLEKGVLTVSGEKKSEHADNGKPNRIERRYGKFSRSLDLNGLVDESKVEADFSNGVLTLVLPKKAEARTRQVAIKVG